MTAIITLPSKYFITLYKISEGEFHKFDEELIKYLVDEEYVLTQGIFGWALTSKGREFMRQFGNDRDFLDVIRADWPNDLIAILRRCRSNSRPEISRSTLLNLVINGYLIEEKTDQYILSDSAKEILSTYHD